LKYLLIPIFIALSLPAFAKMKAPKRTTVQQPAPVVHHVETMPGFDGDLMQYMIANLRYPDQARKNNIQGRVLVQFVVRKDGRVADAKIAKSANPLLDAEALRVVRIMPKWIPGRQDGKPVDVYFTLPVTFKLD
jgi:protein TonB